MITPPPPATPNDEDDEDVAGKHSPGRGKTPAYDIQARLDREAHEEYVRQLTETPLNAPQHDIAHSPAPQVRDQRNF